MTDEMRDALRGEAEPLAKFGVSIKIPWWRRKLQWYLAPRRFQLWAQRTILEGLDGKADK